MSCVRLSLSRFEFKNVFSFFVISSESLLKESLDSLHAAIIAFSRGEFLIVVTIDQIRKRIFIFFM